MKAVRIFLFVLLMFFVAGPGLVTSAHAQCSMCTINAEQGVKNGNTQSKGINTGVLYLMGAPFLLAAGVGGVWYLKYRNEDTDTE
jgi:hypothetical protein